MSRQPSIYYIRKEKLYSSQELALSLQKLICHQDKIWSEVVFLCIGTDSITGDCLGPLIGHHLSQYRMKNVEIYGTLAEPIHALNLQQTLLYIKKKHPCSLIIAIDASLGSKKNVGYITLGSGPIYPGAGVQKKLPPVGDIFITGIVNECGSFNQLSLQSTRLSLIVDMAELITEGITHLFLHKDDVVFSMVRNNSPEIHRIRRTCP